MAELAAQLTALLPIVSILRGRIRVLSLLLLVGGCDGSSLQPLDSTLQLSVAEQIGFAGRSLARYWQSRSPGVRVVDDPLLMETTKPELIINGGREPAARGPMKAVVAAGMHYIQMADGSEEFYNINSDVEEKVNLAREGKIRRS